MKSEQRPLLPTSSSSSSSSSSLSSDDASTSSLSDSTGVSWRQSLSYTISFVLVTLCVSLCTCGISARQTIVSQQAHPAVAILLMWLLIFFLGILEGGQGCLVGLQPISPSLYRDTHPHTYRCTTRVVPNATVLNRFIVGRQFLVVLVVFLLNLCCTTVGPPEPGVYGFLLSTLVSSGLAVMILTVVLGQLAAEVNATNCMLDFINTPIVVVTTVLCLAVEGSGLLHAVYLVQCFFPKENEDSSSSSQGMAYWMRVLLSVTLLTGAMLVTCAALWRGETTMGGGTALVSFVLFVGLVCFLGLLEAIQIAVFAVAKIPAHLRDPKAAASCDLVFEGRNFKAVLIGRQICVTTSMFLLARITTTNVDPLDLAHTSPLHSTVLGVPPPLQDFFNTGLPGALITTIVASLAWRIVAASFPVAFMANPVVYWTIRLCLVLEASGVFSAAWVLADGIKWVLGFRTDDSYTEEKKLDDTLSISSSADSWTDYGSQLSESERNASTQSLEV